MIEEGRKNITTEKLVAELYLAKFGYLASSASHSHKNCQAKGIQDDQMFSSVELKVEVLKKTKHYQGFAVNVVDLDRQRKTTLERKKIREFEEEAAYERLHWYSAKKKKKKCKDHGGPIADIKELNKLI